MLVTQAATMMRRWRKRRWKKSVRTTPSLPYHALISITAADDVDDEDEASLAEAAVHFFVLTADWDMSREVNGRYFKAENSCRLFIH